jgi:hypothetical protein
MLVAKVRRAAMGRRSVQSRRVLCLQWNQSQQKSRANAPEQSTFEAPPAGQSRCGRIQVLRGSQFVSSLQQSSHPWLEGSAKLARRCEVQNWVAAIKRDFAA